MNTSVETNVWGRILHSLKGRLNQQTFETWFSPIQFESLDSSQHVLNLRAPNQVVKDWVSNHYASVLADSLNDLQLSDYSVDWVIGKGIEWQSDEVPSAAESVDVIQATSVSTGSGVAAAMAVVRDTDLSAIQHPEPSLSAKYTYESFVVGSCNQFAHAASLAVAEAPGRTYNPLYLYGGVGLGKTHLMHAIAGEVLRRNPGANVLYLSAERFLNDLINALRFERMHEFKRRYRELDVLLMDDVQFIAGKDSTQEEFFHTFNALHDAQKQIVLTSDALPKEIPTLEERLRSRFEWGLIADIQPPDLEMKVAIIRKKAAAEKVEVPNDVAMFIAGTVKSNIRELEGRLNRVLAFSSLTGKPLSVELARETLRDIVGTEEHKAAPSEILKTVASHYGLRVSDMKAKSNAKPVAFPRQVAMYLCRKLTELSYPEIGRLFNDKHHSTVMHSVEKIERMIEDDADFRRVIDGFLQAYR